MDAPPAIVRPPVLTDAEFIEIAVRIADEAGIDRLALVALGDAESTRGKQQRRPENPERDRYQWPDVSGGIFHQAVRWSDEFKALGLPGVYPGPEVTEAILAKYYDPEYAGRVAAAKLRHYLDQEGQDVLRALSRYNAPNTPPEANPHRGRYAESIDRARRLLADLEESAMQTITIGNWEIADIRAELPPPAGRSYTYRPLSDIEVIIIHHSDSPTLPVDATVEQEIAAFKAINKMHSSINWPTPADGGGRGVAYHMGVAPSGRAFMLAPWDTRRWHSGDFPDGTSANQIGLAILALGTFTDVAPGDAQLLSLSRLCAESRFQLGQADMPAIGHKEVAGASVCPGRVWLDWKPLMQPSAAPPEPAPPTGIEAVTIQLNALWGYSWSLPAELTPLQQQSIIAIKQELGIP